MSGDGLPSLPVIPTEERVREIVREELAAHEARQFEQFRLAIGDAATALEAQVATSGVDLDDLPISKQMIEGLRNIERGGAR